jgi:murein L,D-transpeptidase YcbB/YkuD
VPAGKRLVPGDTGARVAALGARLRAEGYLPPEPVVSAVSNDASGASATAGADSARYGPDVAAAVASFQTRHGLAVDSAVGPATLAALNVPAARRALQIEANVERYRWLPHDVPSTPVIVVNIPSFQLIAFDSGHRVLEMRVVVGSELTSRRTPVFADSMEFVEFGPYWNVPPSIARNEILPKVARDRGYLARNNYQIVRGWGDDAPPVDARKLSNAQLYSSAYRVRQLPGPKNALGRVKFLFPNEFNVYLHDTPAQALFDDPRRAASHGCVRLSDPLAVAKFALAGVPEWPAPRIEQAFASYKNERVTLAHKVPVYLLYLTAFQRGGQVAFRDDLYEMDNPLLTALGAPEPPGTDALVARLRRLVAGIEETTER